MSDAYPRLVYEQQPSAPALEDKPLETGGGGGDSNDMDQRVTRLEEWAKLSGERMGRVEDKLDTIIGKLGALPSRTDLIVYALTGLGVSLAVVGAIVGALAVLR